MTLPVLHFSTAGLPPGEAFERWRTLMAPMFRAERAPGTTRLPSGENITFLIGEILVNRTTFDAQHFARDERLVDATPDHIVLQYCRSGGFTGEIAGNRISYKSGQVVFADRRRTLVGSVMRSDSIGLTLPRKLLSGVKADAIGSLLDPDRGRLAAAKILELYGRLPGLAEAQVAATSRELLAFANRLFDPSSAADVLTGSEFDDSLTHLAQRIVLANLGSPHLSPEFVAERLGVSRSKLYRLFAPTGGIMRHVAEKRLLAVCAMLGDPLERRSLTRLSEDYGFSSVALFSRTFRTRFGLSPREWRKQHVSCFEPSALTMPLKHWWSELGSDQPLRHASHLA